MSLTGTSSEVVPPCRPCNNFVSMGQTGQASDHHHRSSGAVCLFASCGSLLCCKHWFRRAAPDSGAIWSAGLATKQ